MSDEIADKIGTVPQGPASVQTDAGTVVAQSIPDMIAADKYLASRAAPAAGNRGLRFNKLIPPGTT
jgi:hypothetical protein